MEKLNRKILHSNIIYTFILGVLWGFLEIVANEYLVPNNIYIKGLIFSFIAVVVLIFSKKIVNYKFSLLLVSIITILIILASRGFSFNIMIAVFSEALIAEVIFFLSPRINHITFMAVSALIFSYSFIHGVIFHGSLPGNYIVYLYKKMFSDIFGQGLADNIYFIVIFWGIISFILGLLVGWLIWQVIIRFYQKIIDKLNFYFQTE